MVAFLSLAETASSPATASYSEQGSVGSWAARIALTLVVLLVVLLVLAAFRRGWRRRGELQTASGLGVLPTSPGSTLPEPGSVHDSFHVKYIGTARSDDRFTRAIAGGGPAQAQMLVSVSGLRVDRQGESPLFIVAESIVDVGSGRGLLQKAYARHGLLMVVWRWNEQEVVSGFWLAEKDEHIRALEAIERLAGVSPTTWSAVGEGVTQGGQQ